MTTKSEIKPLVKAKNINEKFDGDSVKMKVVLPLSKSSMGHYSIKDLLSPTCDKEDKNYKKCLKKLDEYYKRAKIPDDEKSFFQRFAEGAKFDLFNFFVKMGVSSKLRYSVHFWELKDLDPKFLKEARISKIFFALEDCDKEDEECKKRQEEKPLTFDFLEKFFLNISVIQDKDSLDFVENPLAKLSKKQFNRYAERAFGQQVRELKDVVDEDGNVSDRLFYNLNIARFDNSKKNKKRRRINNTDSRDLRDNGKTFIFNLQKDNVMLAKNFFTSELFDGVVKDATLIGNSLYIDLYGSKLKNKFFEIFRENATTAESLSIIDYRGCTSQSCTNLVVNDLDLTPMLKKSREIKLDTYVSIKHLDYNDFKYSGYIELTLELDLPY